MNDRKSKYPVMGLPVGGIILFILLYLLASYYYPGGSQHDLKQKGFSWMHNYWCNLLNERALNGQPNQARIIALTAWGVLTLSLGWFWFYAPVCLTQGKPLKHLIRISGLVCALTSLFLFTSYHDGVINLAGGMGMIACAGLLVALKRSRHTFLYRMGLFSFVWVALNNLIYYGSDDLYYLPVVQKFTFVYFLLWFLLISLTCVHNHPYSTRQTIPERSE
ncbi:MAG TPA: hypothetical protein VHK91_01800 [Flavisolibacter sp.]|jgi:hypothetical protein|nr:hypothetical protein [Flavisolibacter sp.]